VARLKLDQDTLGFSNLLERKLGVRVKDCFKDSETIYCIVSQGQMGKALGKGGSNIHKVQDELGKRVKIIEYREDPVEFIKNVIYPLKVEQIVLGEGVIILKDSNRKTKSLLIGRESRNINLIKRAIQRFFNVDVKIE